MSETWRRRRARAEKLEGAHAPAADLLNFYLRLLECQEAIYVSADPWVNAIEEPTSEHCPIDIRRFSGTSQRKAFHRFVGDAGGMATPLLGATAARLVESTTSTNDLLEQFVMGSSLDRMAGEIECDAAALVFFPRAFIQPIAEAAFGKLQDLQSLVASSQAPVSCPHCDWPPQLSLLVDEVEVQGRRLLACSLCGGEWTFPRATCPACGETDAKKLPYHQSESWSHVRIEECMSCHSYLKSIDMRIDGLAIPVVDEIASVELDLWASEQGLKKIQTNLLGL